ncbi:MAG: magnesium chelatase subunit D [Acetobacteraceae bacterium]|nr:magnesium chelatase subunit D [Acetobacteraceae bacterium]
MSPTPWSEALWAAALLAVDPGTGGIALRALPGPVRDRYLKELRHLFPPGIPVRRLPLHAADDRLLGGLDLPATLASGRPVFGRGLLAEAHGGLVLVAMAERVSPAVAARIGAVLDAGEVVTERDGLAARSPAAIGVIALDEGAADDERPAAALLDRLAFPVALEGIGLHDLQPPEHDGGAVRAARALLPFVTVPDDAVEALCGTAAALGVASMRAAIFAVRAARAAAALAGRPSVAGADAAVAARLVLAPRATRLPADRRPEGAGDEQQEEPGPETPSDAGDDERTASNETAFGEIVLEAASAAIPPGLLAELAAGRMARTRSAPTGRAGAWQQAARRGRPVGVRRGALGSGAGLNLVETLRAAAPWQTLRGAASAAASPARVVVRPDDFRVVRFRHRAETTTIFLVDASGSAALHRLAEAKGAVELVLGECYIRRDRVALIAFRGTGAELLVPPTTSLVRARRSLAGLPGGGGTPLASGLAAASALAGAVRRKGASATVILLSDGRANVARDGTPGRARAEEDALAAGRMLRESGVAALLVDTSPRPSPQAKRLAGEMGARYLPLPYADAEAVSRAARSAPRA